MRRRERPEPARIEPPAWYREFDPAAWDEPDGHEQSMMAGCSGARCWPDSPMTVRWPDWPEFLHEGHARRRWFEAQHRYRQQHPALATQEFDELVNGERAARRSERERYPGS